MSNTVKTIQATFVILMIMFSTILQAEVNGHYRWQDTDGNVHYSDRPPAGIESEFIKFSTGKRSASPEQEKTTASKKDGNKPADGQRKMEILPEKNPKLCTQAQANMNALGGARIRITEPDGSQRFLTEDEKEDQRQNARKFIELHCD